MFSVKLLEPRPELRKCPVLKAASGVAMPSQHLREMILHMVQDGIPQRVLVNMTEQNVKITVGNMELKYEKDEISGTKGWQPGERFCGWLRWPHCKSLKIASISARVVFLCLVTDFRDSFMLRFIINKDWKLTYMKQNNDFAELASSQGNKIVNAGLTERNLTYSFKFLVLPAVTLKFALLSLTEYSFLGSTGLGMIDVNENRFQFTVRNSETGVVGLIHLVASRLINFRCNNDVQGMIVNLEHIAQNLFLTHDNDIIVIYQVDGSNEISFNSGRIESLVRGTGSSRKFAAQLLGSIVEFEDCPDLNNFKCEANIPSQHLREMIPLFIANESPQSVSMEIEYGFVSITIGQQSWDYDYDEKLLEQHHHICFEWPHSESLKWASFLADQFSIRILTDPPNCIMLRFKLQDFGHLIYIKPVDFTRPTLKDKLQHGVATKLTSSRYWPQRYTWTGCYCPQQYADMLDLEDSEQNSSTEASPCSFEQSESARLLIC